MGGNQLLNAELLEVQLEVAEEVAGISAEAVPEMVLSVLSDGWVICVAENDFVLKLCAVVAQLVLNGGELGIKFVSLSRTRHMQIAVARHSDFPRRKLSLLVNYTILCRKDKGTIFLPGCDTCCAFPDWITLLEFWGIFDTFQRLVDF